MSESTYKDDQEFFPQHPHGQLLTIKRAFIEAWISDLPQTVPTPESHFRTTTHPGRRRRQRSRKLPGMVKGQNPASVRRSKRGMSPEYKQLPKPQKKKRTGTVDVGFRHALMLKEVVVEYVRYCYFNI